MVIQASQDSSATTSDTIVVTAAVTSDNLGTASSLMSMMVINSIISSEVVKTLTYRRPSMSWSHSSWIYNYIYNQCLSSSNLDQGEVYNIM